MDPTIAIFLPLIGGHQFIVGYTALKYKVAREDGHRLYFRVAYHGICLLVTSLVIFAGFYLALAQCNWFPDFEAVLIRLAKPLLKSQENVPAQVGFFIVCLGSVALGRIGPMILNKLNKGRIDQALWKAAEENELEELLLESLGLLRTVSITLSSNKVYVGLILTTPEPKTERRVIALLPYMSGYRTETGKVIFTTYYDQFYNKDTPETDAEKFRLVLPVDKMLSVSFFDVDTYAHFNAEPTPRLGTRRVTRRRQGI